jgi:hypothetical protein
LSQAAETERKRIEDERKAQEREAGGQRLKEIDERWTTKALNLATSLGPYVGMIGLGMPIGHRLQRAMMGRSERAAEALAQRADATMARPVQNTDIPGRVGRVNDTGARAILRAPSRLPSWPGSGHILTQRIVTLLRPARSISPARATRPRRRWRFQPLVRWISALPSSALPGPTRPK